MKILPVEIKDGHSLVMLKNDKSEETLSLIGSRENSMTKSLVAFVERNSSRGVPTVFGYAVWQDICPKSIAFTEDLSIALDYYNNCNRMKTPAQIARDAGLKGFDEGIKSFIHQDNSAKDCAKTESPEAVDKRSDCHL